MQAITLVQRGQVVVSQREVVGAVPEYLFVLLDGRLKVVYGTVKLKVGIEDISQVVLSIDGIAIFRPLKAAELAQGLAAMMDRRIELVQFIKNMAVTACQVAKEDAVGRKPLMSQLVHLAEGGQRLFLVSLAKLLIELLVQLSKIGRVGLGLQPGVKNQYQKKPDDGRYPNRRLLEHRVSYKGFGFASKPIATPLPP
jgi:hypothetical protein